MLFNYFKIAVRNIRRTTLFSSIAILGLAVGMAASLLILHYVNFEKKMVNLVETHANELMRYYKVSIELKMQPLTDIHLTSHFMQEYEIIGGLPPAVPATIL